MPKEAMMEREFQPKHYLAGATVVEYVLVVAFIAIAVVITLVLVGQQLDKQYQRIAACVQNPTSACQTQ
jgi:Flp pilus assembly pilin Flp